MLTPQELQSKKFVKAVFGGYDMREVDDFLDATINDYEKLYKENAALKGKLKVLAEKVEEYRSVDDEMRKALLEAKRTAAVMVSEAEKSSKEMTEDAQVKARSEITELRDEVIREEKRLELAKLATAEYIAATEKAGESFLASLSMIPAVKIDIKKPMLDKVEVAAKEIEETLDIEPKEEAAETSDFNISYANPGDETEDDGVETRIYPMVTQDGAGREVNFGGISVMMSSTDMKQDDDEQSLEDIFKD